MAKRKDEGGAAVAEAPETANDGKPEQKVTVEDAGPARKKLTIELPESRIKGKVEDTFKSLRDDAVIPGFRRGRAPRRLIERRFGEAMQQDAKSQLITEAYTQAIEDQKLDVLGEPEVQDIENLKVPESGPLTFVVEVEVAPEVKLPDFATIEVKKTKAEVKDEDVEAEIERYRERMGKMTTAEEGSEIGENDYVQGDVHIYEGEGVEAKPHSEDKSGPEPIDHRHGVYTLVHGEEQDFKGQLAGILVPDLGKRLLGKKAGDEVSISMTGPQGHEDERIKGKPITIHFKITSVQRLDPAPVEKVAEQLGYADLDALKADLKPVLEQRIQQKTQSEMHRQVTDQLLEKVEFELPPGITGKQAARVLRRQAMELAYQGVPEAQIEQQIAEARAGSEDTARKQLKLFFILNEAAEQLKIEVSEQEINGRIYMLAMQQGRRPEKLRQQMQQQGQIEQLYLQLREQKTLDKIIEGAKVEEVDAPAEEAKPKKKSGGKKKKASGGAEGDAS